MPLFRTGPWKCGLAGTLAKCGKIPWVCNAINSCLKAQNSTEQGGSVQTTAGSMGGTCSALATPGPPAHIWWGRHSAQRAPLLTNGEQACDYHPRCKGGRAVPAVAIPPCCTGIPRVASQTKQNMTQAYQELQVKQNKTKQNMGGTGYHITFRLRKFS